MVPLAARRRWLFGRAHGYALPSLPQTFSEKVQWRILHDRRPLIRLTGDKLQMKAYAAAHSTQVRVPETLWSGVDLEGIIDRDWGGNWVLKPISGWGFAAFGTGSLRSSGIDLRVVRRWRFDTPGLHGEWVYSEGEPGYLIERRIEQADGGIPNDLKCWVFGGRTRLIFTSIPRSLGQGHRFYSPAWEPLSFCRADVPLSAIETAPEHLAEVVAIADELGAAYDFIRVDLYDTPSGVWFGELTPYPAGGLKRFEPVAADLELGSWWSLPD